MIIATDGNFNLSRDICGRSFCTAPARGDFREDSDYDIMILTDLDEFLQKKYQKDLFYMTYDFSLDHDVDIKPIAKEGKFFMHWVEDYPFYRNIQQEGVVLYDAA